MNEYLIICDGGIEFGVFAVSENEAKAFDRGDWMIISAEENRNIDALQGEIWSRLSLMRIYMKRIGKEPDMVKPLIIKSPANVQDVANKIHREVFGGKVEYAKIWGPSARFEGQFVGINRPLSDKDIIELHLKR